MNYCPLKSGLNSVPILKILCKASLPTIQSLIAADDTLKTQSLFTVSFSALNVPLCACHNWQVWIAIAAENTKTLVEINTYGTYSIAVLVQFARFSTNVDFVLQYWKRFFLLLWLFDFFVFWPRPGPMRIEYEGFHCKFKNTTMRTNLAKPEVTLLGLLLRLYNTVHNVQGWTLETVDLRWRSCHNSVWGGFPKCLQVLH